MRWYFQNGGGVLAITGIWLLSVASGAHAQIASPSQVTPQSLRPAASPDQGITLLVPSSQAAPKGAEGLDVVVGDVLVDGGFVECASQHV